MDLIGLVSKATRHFFDAGTISVDNWTFKMYYKLTIVVVIVMTTMVTSRQFFGHPIYCDAGSVSSIIIVSILSRPNLPASLTNPLWLNGRLIP